MDTKNAAVTLESENNVLRAAIVGEIDHHCAKNIRQEIDSALLSAAPDKLIIDMGGVTFMDSSGLGLILGRYTKAEEAGTQFAVQGAHGRVRQMFDMAGLDRIITFEGDTKK